MGKLVRPILLAVLVTAVTAAAVLAGVVLWQRASTSGTYLTDARGLAIPIEQAMVRDVIWAPAEIIGAPLSDPQFDDVEPRLSGDGSAMFFVRITPGRDADILISSRTGSTWSRPVPVEGLNTPADEISPLPLPDGSGLVLASNRSGGVGGYDLYHAPFARDPATGRPDPGRVARVTNMGRLVNTPFHEHAPAVAPDGATMVFATNRARQQPGADPTASTRVQRGMFQGDYDLYAVEVSLDGSQAEGAGSKDDPTFQPQRPAMRLHELCTESDDTSPALSPGGDALFFASNRPGGLGGFDIYRARIAGPALPIEATDGIVPAPSAEASEPGPWPIHAIENLGEAINTEADELDPALGWGGFELVFSSNRAAWRELAERDANAAAPQGGEAAAPAGATVIAGGRYDLYRADSREVLRRFDQGRAQIALMDLLQRAWPWIALALLVLITVLLLYRLLSTAGFRRRWQPLSVMAKCIIVSVAAHLLLMSALAAWHVTAGNASVRDASALKSVIAVRSVGGDVAGQLRPELAQLQLDATTPADTPRTEPSATPTQATAPEAMQPQQSQPVQAEALQRTEPTETAAQTPTTLDAVRYEEPVATQAEAAQPIAKALRPSVDPTVDPSAEAPRSQPVEASATALVPSPVAAASQLSPEATPRIQAQSIERATVEEAAQAQPRHELASTPIGEVSAQPPNASAQLPSTAPSAVRAESSVAPTTPTVASSPASLRSPEPAPPSASVASLAVEAQPALQSAPMPVVRDVGESSAASMEASFDPPQVVALDPAPSPMAQLPASESREATAERSVPATAEVALPSTQLRPDTTERASAEVPTAQVVAQPVEPTAMASQPMQVAASRVMEDAAVSVPTPVASSVPMPVFEPVPLPQLPVLEMAGAEPSDPPSPSVEARPLQSQALPESPRARSDVARASELAAPELAPERAKLDVPAMPMGAPTPSEAMPAARTPPTGLGVVDLPGSLAFDIALPTVADAGAPAEEMPGRITGQVLSAQSRQPLTNATVRLDLLEGKTLIVQTDAQGRYELRPSGDLPENVAVSASADGYTPESTNIRADDVRRGVRAVFMLAPVDPDIIAIEDDPQVHHLGNDEYSGTINSQFQKQSSGLIWTRPFMVAGSQLPPHVDLAEIRMLAKGTQAPNEIWVNDQLVRKRLDGSPRDGSFGLFRATFPAQWLREGENTIEIRSKRGTADLDDFEFVNVQIHLKRPTRTQGPVRRAS